MEFAPYQEIGSQYPDISTAEFQTSVQLVDRDEKRYRGAEAVFRTLGYARGKAWLLWSYRHIPGVRFITEWFYRLVAAHRVFFSSVTRFFWGNHLEIPSYHFSDWLFLRVLAGIYLIAFVSLGIQIKGLVGSAGILPVANFLEAVQNQTGMERFWNFPTLAWLNGSDGFLLFLSFGGAALSALALIGFAPVLLFFLQWLFYLSLFYAGQDFLSFQWDILLLETGFLAIFLSSFHLLPKPPTQLKASGATRWLAKWLLFRLMFSSGIVKLLSGDAAWRSLKALNYHYETQPLPTWPAWYAHQLPHWFQKISTVAMFTVELLVPFLIFAPRRLRLFSCGLLIGFQLLIMATGNYCFFNLLTVALCILLIDDGTWPDGIKNFFSGKTVDKVSSRTSCAWPRWVTAPLFFLILMLSSMQFFRTLHLPMTWPEPLVIMRRWVTPLRIVNPYGLFAVMTTARPEIVIEGSDDGVNWKPYEFYWKPGDPYRVPAFVAPHQPRLDWQMWFAALSHFQRNPWFTNFMFRLMQGEPNVLRLLKTNPFPGEPPQQLRAKLYVYSFSSLTSKKATGAWWERSEKGYYLPTFKRRGNQVVLTN